MKKLTLVLAAVFALTLSACSVRTDSATDAPLSGSVVELNEGVWPENDYTAGLPVPPGTVMWAVLDREHENCGIHLADITESDYHDYVEQLEQEALPSSKTWRKRLPDRTMSLPGCCFPTEKRG